MLGFRTKTRPTPVLDNTESRIQELSNDLADKAQDVKGRIDDLSAIAVRLSEVAQNPKLSEEVNP